MWIVYAVAILLAVLYLSVLDWNPTPLRGTPYPLLLKLKPHSLGRLQVRSSSVEGKKYVVDLLKLRCSCPDFRKRRWLSRRESLGRCCKHMLGIIVSNNLLIIEDDWMRVLIEAGDTIPSRAWILDLETAPKALLTAHSGSDWVNIYAHTKRPGERISNASGNIKSFGWHIFEHEWFGCQSPPGSREINKILKDFYPHKMKRIE